MTDQTKSHLRRYTAQGLLAASAIGLGVWGVTLSLSGGAQAQGDQRGASGLNEEEVRQLATDAAVNDELKHLCDQVCLQPEDFVALEASGEQCEAALTRLKDWIKANRARLDQADQAIAGAKGDLSELQRKIRTGEATPEEVESAGDKRKAIAAAQGAQKVLMLEGGAAALSATVGNDKAQRWKKAQTWAAILPVEVRYHPDMDRRRLEAIISERGRLGVPLDEVLSFAEKQAADEARARIEQQGGAVTTAWQRAVRSGESGQ